MWLSDKWRDYELIDCGRGEKLERWGDCILVRPDPQAIWDTAREDPLWRRPDARYARSSTGGGQWEKKDVPQQWKIAYRDLTFQVKPMNFKHTGLFPEQAANWDFCMERIRKANRPISVLNLFAYTGGATVACAAAGASVCHVDAAKGMVSWARENAKLSGLEGAPIRWIIDDCGKFVEREIRRGRRYDAVIMDPLLWARPFRRGLEAGGQPLSLCGVGGGRTLQRAPFLSDQLLHHRACSVGAHLYFGNGGHKAPRRPYRQR